MDAQIGAASDVPLSGSSFPLINVMKFAPLADTSGIPRPALLYSPLLPEMELGLV